MKLCYSYSQKTLLGELVIFLQAHRAFTLKGIILEIYQTNSAEKVS